MANILNQLNIKASTQIVLSVGITLICVYVMKNRVILVFNKYRLYYINNLVEENIKNFDLIADAIEDCIEKFRLRIELTSRVFHVSLRKICVMF